MGVEAVMVVEDQIARKETVHDCGQLGLAQRAPLHYVF